ncbi:hypothetical protein P9112_006541 [Eukaryota sp. TZLM1-RC]
MSQFGVIGLATMGMNLALNVERNGFKTSVFNRTTSKTEAFETSHGDKNIVFAKTLEQFVSSLERPRKILLMVKAGNAVDSFIDKLLPLIENGDIVIDGGNSFYKDSDRRFNLLQPLGIHFVGLGISGGELGALYGPSLMAGCSVEAWKSLKPILEAIAANAPQDQRPCVGHFGPKGSGHLVKTVHNGIEYGLLQLLAEAYDLMRKIANMSADKISDVFQKWNEGPLKSYLVEISVVVLKKKLDDIPTKNVVDIILDKAGAKGTGAWTSQIGFDAGYPIPTINIATSTRSVSSFKDVRTKLASKRVETPVERMSPEVLVPMLEKALLTSFLCCYVQGMDMLAEVCKESGYGTDMTQVAAVWRNGCIIRSEFLLQELTDAYTRNPSISHLLLDNRINELISEGVPYLRRIVPNAVLSGIPLPALSSILTYYEAMHTENLPANFIQGLRDLFGAHTYKRLDKNTEENFHTEWYS